MKLSKDARRLSKDLFHFSLTSGQVDGAKVSQVAQKVIQERPRQYISVLKEYQRLIRLELEKHHATIESAVSLDAATQAELLTSLKAKYGSDLTSEFKVSPELLGGLRIKIGSDVFDSSVRERLQRLENQLTLA